jgi:hypothetical protein
MVHPTSKKKSASLEPPCLTRSNIALRWNCTLALIPAPVYPPRSIRSVREIFIHGFSAVIPRSHTSHSLRGLNCNRDLSGTFVAPLHLILIVVPSLRRSIEDPWKLDLHKSTQTTKQLFEATVVLSSLDTSKHNTTRTRSTRRVIFSVRT